MVHLDDVINVVIKNVEPSNLKPKFVLLAKIVNNDGDEKIVDGNELSNFFDGSFSFAEMKIVFDIKKIKSYLLLDIKEFFENIKI